MLFEKYPTIIDGLKALAGDEAVAVPLARAHVGVGDFVAAAGIVEQAGGAAASPDLASLSRLIEQHTAKTLASLECSCSETDL